MKKFEDVKLILENEVVLEENLENEQQIIKHLKKEIAKLTVENLDFQKFNKDLITQIDISNKTMEDLKKKKKRN